MRYTAVAIAVLCALFFRAFLVSVYKVPSQSMAPTILSGDFVLSSQVSYGFRFPWSSEILSPNLPQRGDLVIYIKDSKVFIRRVLALPGEKVEVVNGQLSIDSKSCQMQPEGSSDDPHFVQTEDCLGSHHLIVQSDQSQITFESAHLRNKQFLVVADNRMLEAGQNVAEIIEFDQIIGKPLLIWMSFSSTRDFISDSTGFRWNRILTKPL